MGAEKVHGVSKLMRKAKVLHKVSSKRGKKGKVASAKEVEVDKVSISEEAKEKQKISQYVEVVKSLPDVRAEVVKKVKKKLDKGVYHSPDVVKKTAEKMLEDI